MPHLLLGDFANAVEAGRRAIEINPLFSSAYKGYLSALGLMGRQRETGTILRRLLALEPGFSVRQAVLRSPLTRPEDVARYAEGLRRAGLREKGEPLDGDPQPLTFGYSAIDLVPRAPHSPVIGVT